MNRIRTLRVRFALWTAGLMLMVFLLFGTVVYFSMRQGLARSIDDSLRLSASQAIAAVNIENGQINYSDSLPESAPISDLQGRGLTIQIVSTEGKTIQSTGPYQTLPVDTAMIHQAGLGKPGYTTLFTAQGERVRVYSEAINENQHLLAIIQVMQSLNTLTATLDRLLVILLVSIPVLVLISALSGYFLAAQALSPIDQMTRTAQRISAEDLSARLNFEKVDDEVGRLASTFDQMLSRLEDAFQRERQFTADASHELRTPLAATQAIFNVIREKRRSPEEYERALDDIAEETERLRTITENLLYIARGDTRQMANMETIPFSELLVNVAESLMPMATTKGLVFQWNVPGDLYIEGDNDALIRLFVNLIDNAVKYTDHGSILLEAAQTSEREIQVQLKDTGRGIPSEHLPHIFERFYRVETSRTTQGSGLGLAIVQEIVQAHSGRIEATSHVGIGTCFQITFPGLLVGKPP